MIQLGKRVPKKALTVSPLSRINVPLRSIYQFSDTLVSAISLFDRTAKALIFLSNHWHCHLVLIAD